MKSDEESKLEELARAIADKPRGEWEYGSIGQYSLVRGLGIGAMGATYAAFDERRNECVAFKIVRPDMLGVPCVLERFENEVARIRDLQHSEWIVKYVDSGIHSAKSGVGELPFLCMRLIEGRTLAKKLETWGRFPQVEAARIGVELLSGIADIHARGCTHRDLKPANILLHALIGEKVQIADFGLAHQTDDRGLDLSRGNTVGTRRYIAPERWNDPDRNEPASDLFSVGCILYETLTGRSPFSDNERSSIVEMPKLKLLADVLPEVDPGLEQIVMRLLEARPERRFETARDTRSALEHVLLSISAPSRGERRWPKFGSEQICRRLSNLAPPTFGVPLSWCRRRVGVLLGLGRRLQLAAEVYAACVDAFGNLLRLENEHLRCAPNAMTQSELLAEITKIWKVFREVASRAIQQSDGFHLLQEQISESNRLVENFQSSFLAQAVQSDLHDATARDVLRDRVRTLAKQLNGHQNRIVEIQEIALDRMLVLIETIDRGLVWSSEIPLPWNGVQDHGLPDTAEHRGRPEQRQ